MDMVVSWLKKCNTTNYLIRRDSLLVFFMLFFCFFAYRSYKVYHAPYNEDFRIGRYIAYAGGDTPGYIQPIENFIQTGQYYRQYYVGRGPYYGVVYFVFRQFLPIDLSCDCVALFQILCFSVALTFLIKLLHSLVNNKLIILLVYPIIVFLPYDNSLVNRIITESLTLSGILIFVYYYKSFNETQHPISLVIASCCLAIISVMKPYLLIIFAICGIDFLFTCKPIIFKSIINYGLIMSSPLIIICTPFTIHNYLKWDVFAPMQNTTYAGAKISPVFKELRSLIKLWGEDYTSWDNNALGTFFYPNEGFEYSKLFPKSKLTTAYSYNDICALRDDYQHSLVLQGREKSELEESIIRRIHYYKTSYKKEHPLAEITSRLHALGYIIKIPDLSFKDLTGFRGFISDIYRFLCWISYYIVTLLGFIGLIILAFQNKSIKFILFIALYLSLFFTICRIVEHRFFLHVMYLNIIGAIYFIDYGIIRVINKIRTRKLLCKYSMQNESSRRIQ